ncbi:FAD-linked oxidase-like protein [Boletus coccyginus]|nr:FAD-linked oxidase-like protein [Boletus coccyginus]
MSRSTLLRSISSRTAATSTTSVASRSFCIPRLRHASTGNTAANSRTTSLPVLLGAFTCAFLGYTIGSSAGLPSQAASTLGLGRQQPAPAENDEPTYGTPEDFQQAIQELRHTFSDGPHESGVVSTDPDDLRIHGFSENDHHPGAPHTVVVYPRGTDDVVKIVKIATKYRMPITPFSGGTSLEGSYRGHAAGGICVDMSNMDKILEIHEQDSDIVCQSGARWMEINEVLQKKGIPLFFPLDPGPGATIGGMMSTGCSGTNAVRYGTAKGEWFLNATVVLPSGEVIKTRQRARKSSAGFDVTKLFIGAEGTLGIITEVTIRLAPLLPTTVAVVPFPNVKQATEAATHVMNRGVGIQCVELCDSEFMRSTNFFGASKRTYPETDCLFFKFQGPTQTSIRETAQIVREIVKEHGATGFELARSDKEAKDIWDARKNGLYSGLARLEGARGWGTDVCVPVSRLPDLVFETKQDIEEVGLVSTIVGHVGDGNFHALLLFRNEEELAIVREVVHRMVERAIRMEGTCTGEHGVGIGKREYLYSELGEGTVELMRLIKKTIDPLGLFNPGKLYPDKSMKNPGKH